MRTFPCTPFIAAPRTLTENEARPTATATLTLRELCTIAGVPLRVTSPHTPRVYLHRGAEHLAGPEEYWVGCGVRAFRRRETDAVRVLEVLAHGFHDYAARECVCGRGLFAGPRRRGRPVLGGRPMTAAERMRRMRRGAHSR